jgi:hypothetical protein
MRGFAESYLPDAPGIRHGEEPGRKILYAVSRELLIIILYHLCDNLLITL